MRQQKLAQNTGSFEWAMLVTSKTSNCGWYQDTSYCIRLSLFQSLHSINLAINLRCVAFNDCDLNVWAIQVKFHCSNHFNRGKTQHSIISAGYSISKWIQESVQSVHGKFGRLLQILRAWLFMCKMLHLRTFKMGVDGEQSNYVQTFRAMIQFHKNDMFTTSILNTVVSY